MLVCAVVSVVSVSVSVSVSWFGCCLVDCSRCVVCCTLTFRADVEASLGYRLKGSGLLLSFCPRLFEILTTMTVGAQRQNHIVSPSI